ncbi:MAG: hypothetical protein M1840_000205 [Geoglossum simile]|nr:MAG: hypothetical protein M1840_000205 [Geoglossum simile]
MPPERPSGLESLPLEIRQKIYGLLGYPVLMNKTAFVDRFVTVQIPVRDQYRFLDATGEHAHRKVSNYLSFRHLYPEFSPSLLRVNRAISADLYTLLYSGVMISFLFDISSSKPLFLSTRPLSYLTHVTIGPLYQYNPKKVYDYERVSALANSLNFICHNCPLIEVLGVHIVAGDFLQLPDNGHECIYQALSDATKHCASLKRLIIGLGKFPYESVELASLPEMERDEEMYEWILMVLVPIRLMIEDTYSDQKKIDRGLPHRGSWGRGIRR